MICDIEPRPTEVLTLRSRQGPAPDMTAVGIRFGLSRGRHRVWRTQAAPGKTLLLQSTRGSLREKRLRPKPEAEPDKSALTAAHDVNLCRSSSDRAAFQGPIRRTSRGQTTRRPDPPILAIRPDLQLPGSGAEFEPATSGL
jgi:hypothetical protein